MSAQVTTYFVAVGSKSNKTEKFIRIRLTYKLNHKRSVISFGEVLGRCTALGAVLFKRIGYFCIPTTMTSIVDSSIGKQ